MASALIGANPFPGSSGGKKCNYPPPLNFLFSHYSLVNKGERGSIFFMKRKGHYKTKMNFAEIRNHCQKHRDF